METNNHPYRKAWNKGKLVGQKAPLKPKGYSGDPHLSAEC